MLFWGRCSLIGLLVVMSVIVVLVLQLFSFPVDGVGGGEGCSCPLVLCSLLLLSVLDRLQPHRNSNTHQTRNNTTNVILQQNSRKLLMMDLLMSETC